MMVSYMNLKKGCYFTHVKNLKYGKSGTNTNFNTPSTILNGPFDCYPHPDDIAATSFALDMHQIDLGQACRAHSIMLPTLSSSTRYMIARVFTYCKFIPILVLSDEGDIIASLKLLTCLFSKKKGLLVDNIQQILSMTNKVYRLV